MAPHRPLPNITTLLRPTHHLHRRSLHQPHHLRPPPVLLLYRQQESPSTLPISHTSRLLRPRPSPSPIIHHHQPPPNHRTYSTETSPPSDPPRPYTVPEIRHLTTSPHPRRLIIDVREPAELSQTGRIPGALSMPLTSNPDAFYLGDVEFLERFGWERPSTRGGEKGIGESPFTPGMKEAEAGAGLNAESDKGEGEAKAGEYGTGDADGIGEQGGVEEVVFYCRAGVRSRAAARMAREWKGIKVGDMPGGWLEWEAKGGEVER